MISYAIAALVAQELISVALQVADFTISSVASASRASMSIEQHAIVEHKTWRLFDANWLIEDFTSWTHVIVSICAKLRRWMRIFRHRLRRRFSISSRIVHDLHAKCLRVALLLSTLQLNLLRLMNLYAVVAVWTIVEDEVWRSFGCIITNNFFFSGAKKGKKQITMK